MQKEGPFP